MKPAVIISIGYYHAIADSYYYVIVGRMGSESSSISMTIFSRTSTLIRIKKALTIESTLFHTELLSSSINAFLLGYLATEFALAIY